jgi:hypothetical protein
MPELPDLNAPEFAPIKARFARAYLEHKADLSVPNASDEAVLARVAEITLLLFAASVRAWRVDDQRWRERYHGRAAGRRAGSTARWLTHRRRCRCVRLAVFARRDGIGTVGSSIACPKIGRA